MANDELDEIIQDLRRVQERLDALTLELAAADVEQAIRRLIVKRDQASSSKSDK